MLTFLITGKDKSGNTLFTKRMAGPTDIKTATRKFVGQQKNGHQPPCHTLLVEQAPADKPIPDIDIEVVEDKDGKQTATVKKLAEVLKNAVPAEPFAPGPKA